MPSSTFWSNLVLISFALVLKATQATPAEGQNAARVPAYAWERVTAKAPFAPRDGAGALTYKGPMWLLGGWNPATRSTFLALQ